MNDTMIQQQRAVMKPSVMDTIIITEKCAFFYAPDSLHLEKMKKDEGDEFATVSDDNMYYISTARQYLDSVHIRSVDIDGGRFFKFIKHNGSAIVITKDTVEDVWGIYFFDGIKDPKHISAVDIAEEYKAYF